MTKQAPKFNEYFDKNFWLKNAKVVEIDTCEIVDRLFYCSLTCQLPFQDAFTLTALDRRPFAPPIESQWTKVVNMANTCETFNLSPGTVGDLIAKGFRSLTLLSFADTNMPIKYHWERNGFMRCVNKLNDRKTQPLEPLHSLRRILQHKRRGVQKGIENKPKTKEDQKDSGTVEWLDLAGVCKSETKIPIKMEHKQPASMIARSTFESRDTKKLFGPLLQECRCQKKYRYYGTSEKTSEEDLKSPTLSSSSSGYSSASSNLYSPLAEENISYFQPSPSHRSNNISEARPSPSRTIYPTHRNKHQPYRQYENTRPEPYYKRNQNAGYNKVEFNEKVNCPYYKCNEKMPLSQVDSHCTKIHEIVPAPVVYVNGNYRIEFTLKNIADLLNEDREYWWGPKHFIFDKVTFYQIVYKKYAEYTKENKILFWIWANLPQKEANRYSYEIHLESDRPPDPKYQMRHWKGTVESLEIPSEKMIENKMHKIVYFSLSQIRRHVQNQKHYFTNHHNTPNINHQTTPPLDIKYTVKIMRQS